MKRCSCNFFYVWAPLCHGWIYLHNFLWGNEPSRIPIITWGTATQGALMVVQLSDYSCHRDFGQASVLYVGRKAPHRCSWEVLVCCISVLSQSLEAQMQTCHDTFSPTLARLQLGEAAVWTKLRDVLLKPLCVAPGLQPWLSQHQSWSWREATGLSCGCPLFQGREELTAGTSYCSANNCTVGLRQWKATSWTC